MKDDNQIVGLLVLLAAASIIVPMMAPSLAAAVGFSLIEHHVLVSPAQATLTVPYLGAGLDRARLGLALCALIGVASMGRHLRRGRAHD